MCLYMRFCPGLSFMAWSLCGVRVAAFGVLSFYLALGLIAWFYA